MMVSKITEYTVFESPDGGETIYARMPGSNERIKISESDQVREARKAGDEMRLWQDICRAAKTNAALQEAIDRAILLYYLGKDDGKS
jgi:hypothetical protein